MSIWQAIIYGLVQGLTEFIPVSSSGHLQLLNEVFSFDGTFEADVLVNIGTLLAALVYFKDKILNIITDVVKQKSIKTLLNILISTVPAVFVGFFFLDFFKSDDTRTLTTVVVVLLVVGLAMIILDVLVSKKGRKEVEKSDALVIGLAQVLAFIPGTSRSGSTMIAGRAKGLSYDAAVEYSFILGIPVIAGAILRILITSEGINFIKDNPASFAVGNIVAFMSGMMAIHAMVKLTKRIGLKWFGLYRIILALMLLVTIV